MCSGQRPVEDDYFSYPFFHLPWLLFATALLCLPSLASAQSSSNADVPKPIAIIAGEQIYMSQASPTTVAQLQRLRHQEFEIEIQALDEIVSEKMLANEAKRRGFSVEKLIDIEVNRAVPEPTHGEVEAFYLAQNPSSQGSFTDLEPSLRDSLRKARIETARKRYIKELWSSGQVSVFLRPPRTDVGFDFRRLKGNPAAPIKIIEFSDFSCPYCKRVESTLKEVLSRYGGKVSLAYRDFPLTQLHPHAQTAAEAARCALEQGKFWEYHDLLFAHQDDLRLDILVEKARNLNMNEQAFVSCLNSGRHKRSVDNDIDDGVRAGVLGTPAFFINGVFLAGAQSEEAFEKLIDQELADLNSSSVAIEK